MAIGKRIKYFRKRRGFTQKQFGTLLGFQENTTDVRIAQYEAETRIPKSDLLRKMAFYLHVSPEAISVPDIDTVDGTMQTFFTLEDLGCFHIEKDSEGICLRLNADQTDAWLDLSEDLQLWLEKYTEYRNGKCTKSEYDDWRYNLPGRETESTGKNEVKI
ncbi:MAG: helix-turn-helix domain-containing protein [Bacteroidales bacterium]|nr:helix-turn-helix domain-containing protein [Bacteroidales bacterium]